MSGQYGNGYRIFRWHYILSALASIALSIWGAHATSVPNPDAVLYLRAAEHFSVAQWADGFSIYRWPIYSLLIAGVMSSIGVEPMIAAQIVNGLLILGTTIAFISLAYRLTNGDRAFVTVAAVMIVFQPQLTELRPWVIKDHGYLCFFLTAIYFAVADNQQPSVLRKLALIGSLIAATLFRIEGLFLASLVVVYYVLVRLRTVTQQVSAIVAFTVATTAALPFIFGIWVTGSLAKWSSGELLPANISIFSPAVLKRVEILQNDVLVLGAGQGWQAYISLVVGLALIQTVRALTPVYAFYGLFAFLPHRLLPARAILPIVWFAVGQLPMLILFTFINALLDWRWAMGFALIGMFAAVACATASWRELLMARPRAFLVFPSIVIAFAVSWVLDIPQPSKLGHYKDAGEWVQENVPANAKIWMNEPRIAYFAGLNYREVAGVSRILFLQQTNFEKRGDIDVFVYSSAAGKRTLPLPALPRAAVAIATFPGDNGDFIQILASCPALADCRRQAD